MFVKTVLMHKVGLEDAADTVLTGVTVKTSIELAVPTPLVTETTPVEPDPTVTATLVAEVLTIVAIVPPIVTD
jgi:hypothetical protein